MIDPSTSPAATPREIAARLRHLADSMLDIAAEMHYVGGFAEWAQHHVELAGAAHIAREWADGIDAACQYET